MRDSLLLSIFRGLVLVDGLRIYSSGKPEFAVVCNCFLLGLVV